GKVPNFDTYLVKYTILLEEIRKVNTCLANMKGAAEQADADFASYTSEAVDFCDHFVTMLVGFEPILDATRNLLDLPLKYRNALTQALVKLIKEVGLPDAAADLIPHLF